MRRKTIAWGAGILVLAAGLAAAIPFLEVTLLRYRVLGIDVSHHQGEIDWPRVSKSGVAFAYIKATEGGDWLDKRFNENWERAKAAGIARGAYHFFRSCKSGVEQARNFIARVPKDPDALPPVVDAEDRQPCKPPLKFLDQPRELKAFLDTLEAYYGCRPLVYTTPKYHRKHLKGKLQGERFWLRSMGIPPYYRWREWIIWQYADDGSLEGIAKPVDLNLFRGSPEDFAAFARAGCGKGG